VFQMEEIDVDARDVRGMKTPLYCTVQYVRKSQQLFCIVQKKNVFQMEEIDVDARDVRDVRDVKTPLYSTAPM
jgi:hypothetical protein